MISDTVGIDIGGLDKAAERAPWAREAGATLVRLHLGLGGRASPDDAYLTSARAAVEAIRATGARVLAVLDPELTVAPGGLGAFDDPPGPLAAAWAQEWSTNVGRVAAALGEIVDSWEILPAPNRRGIAPAAWAGHVAAAAEAVRAAGATGRLVAGGVVAAHPEEGAGYLRAAAASPALAAASLWAVGLHLGLFPEGGPDEAAVEAATRAAAESTLAAAAGVLETPRVAVTELAWAAERVGDDVQARNLWASFNALTSVPGVVTIVWRGLVDEDGETGLLAAGNGVARRHVWQAFNDFVLYARQISPAPAFALTEGPGAPEAAVAPLALPEAPVEEPEGEVLTLRVPSAADILATLGLAPAALERAFAELAARYGDPATLGPGEYHVAVPSEAPPVAGFSNQDVISAFYRVGEGTWSVFERSGLSLGELAAHRGEPYSGPPVATMTGLTDAERVSVQEELARQS